MVLFVNACIRGDKSRTLDLCRTYLAGVKQLGAKVREVNLEQMHLAPLSAQKVAFRSQLARAGVYEDDIFDLAHQFAEADDIVIGAPYWDLAFPAALKTYIEHVSADGITFRFTPDARYEGLCQARRITYITSAGSFLTCENAKKIADTGDAGAVETADAEGAACSTGSSCPEGAENASAPASPVPGSSPSSPYAHRARFAPALGCNLGYDYICAIAKMFGIGEVRYAAAEGLDAVGVNIQDQMDKARRQIAQLLADDGLEADESGLA